mmetsp:Transcript_167175/g.536971  ORF Transcript_167175/g.536971 Transcript_167175/m.536971 type:complete len:212 (-) Transcript_167175:1559-2194(-)
MVDLPCAGNKSWRSCRPHLLVIVHLAAQQMSGSTSQMRSLPSRLAAGLEGLNSACTDAGANAEAIAGDADTIRCKGIDFCTLNSDIQAREWSDETDLSILEVEEGRIPLQEHVPDDPQVRGRLCAAQSPVVLVGPWVHTWEQVLAHAAGVRARHLGVLHLLALCGCGVCAGVQDGAIRCTEHVRLAPGPIVQGLNHHLLDSSILGQLAQQA